MDARTGRVFVLTSGTIDVGAAVVARGPFGVSVLDARTGTALETLPLGGTGLALDSRTGRVFVLAVGPTDSAGIGRRPGRVSVLDARTGRLIIRWAWAVGRSPWTSSHFLAGRAVYRPYRRRRVFLCSTRRQAICWSEVTQGSSNCGPAAA